MKEGIITLCLWIIFCLIGYFLYLEIVQTQKQIKLCEKYDLSPSEFREGCKF